MCTVHGISAQAGLEQFVDRMGEAGTPQDIARRMVYGAFDVVVHCEMNPNNRLRWVGEVVARYSRAANRRSITCGSHPRTPVTCERGPPRWCGRHCDQKIRSYFPDFDEARARDDSYAPHTRVGVPDPSRNGHGVHA